MASSSTGSATLTASHDLVVLGGGSGGYAAALRAAQLGLDVALVEADLLGGTCLHRGCIPTKARLHAAHVAEATRDAARVGVRASFEGVDLEGVNAFSDQVVGRLHKGLQGLVSSRGIAQVHGRGRLVVDQTGPAVQVGDTLVRGRHVVLATGSRPRTLGLPIDGERIITSDHAMTMTSLPRTAIVLGGGVIGVEFASMWASFGVEVTIVEALDRLVPAEEPTIAKALLRAFGRRGITVHTGVPVAGATAGDEGVEVALQNGTTLSADLLLVAVGREPVSDDLDFEQAGITLRGRHVSVDENLTTSVPQVSAVGDLVAGLQLAHRGFAQGIFVAERVAHLQGHTRERPRPVREDQIPRVTYCSPEIASVGLTRAQAERDGAVEVVEYQLGGNGRSQIVGTNGFVQLVRRADGAVVGVHMIGDGVSELIGEAALITAWEARPDDFGGLIHAHPTQGEAIGEAIMALAGAPLHAHS
ncbi:dihydrolipoyl dehydrogenase [Aestuariimicrobium ganziense]|uniref:dihydrolipoyl dehydrogenase n=1 Tax=Aestuariimicrobium ganziense TaxID=2773677 RepID=UPI002E2D7373|nr:dihydrolipoyl dehydrogenase [Aestuariimicrobium ganziense]